MLQVKVRLQVYVLEGIGNRDRGLLVQDLQVSILDLFRWGEHHLKPSSGCIGPPYGEIAFDRSKQRMAGLTFFIIRQCAK
jgi:hypothetical protein